MAYNNKITHLEIKPATKISMGENGNSVIYLFISSII